MPMGKLITYSAVEVTILLRLSVQPYLLKKFRFGQILMACTTMTRVW